MKSLVTHLTLRLAVAVSAIAVTSACGTQSQQSVVKSETLQPKYCLGSFHEYPWGTWYSVACNGSTHWISKSTSLFASYEAKYALAANVESQLAKQGIKPVEHFPAEFPNGKTVYSNQPKADFSFCLLEESRVRGCSSKELKNKLERNIALEPIGQADADWHGADAYLNSAGFKLGLSPGGIPFALDKLYVK